MSIYDRRYETMPRAELEQLQLERLQALLARLKRNVRRYREQIGDRRAESLDDLRHLPLTTPEDMAAAFPYGMFALPLREVTRLHPTIGPKGTPLVTGNAPNDLTQWGRLTARQLTAGGGTANDVIQICLGNGAYRGEAGYVLGAEAIEASVIAEKPHHIESQLAMLQNYRPTILVTSPDNAQELARAMERRGIDPPSLHLRTVLLSRPVDRATRDALAAALLVSVRCNFGIEEVLDPGFSLECEEGHFHANEDQYLIETVNGELVVTTLTREAMPLLRYCTRIACAVRREKCPCGRTGAILEPGKRLDGRFLVREAPIYENQIAEVLAQTRAAKSRFRIEITERQVIVFIEMSNELFNDVIWSLMGLQHEIEMEFKTRLGLETEVRLVMPEVRGQ